MIMLFFYYSYLILIQQYIIMLYRQPEKNESSIFDVPIFYKIILAITIFTGISCHFTQKIQVLFINFPYFTIFYLSLWRIFTASFFSIRILQTVISLIMIYIYIRTAEQRLSTVIIASDYLLINMIIQILFSIIWVPIYFINKQSYSNIFSNGTLPICIVYLIRLCYSDPQDSIRFCNTRYGIKKKFIPLIVIGLSCLTQLSIRIDIVIGAILGFLQCKYFKGSLMKLRRDTYESIENFWCFRIIRRFNGFHSISNSKQSKYFCKNQDNSSYMQFYKSMMNSSNSSSQIQVDKIPQTKGSIIMDTSPTRAASSEDFRNHWANKHENQLQQQKNFEQTQSVAQKNKIGYSRFQQQKQYQ